MNQLDTTDGITVHAFIRPGTPPSAGPSLISQIVELRDFGMLGSGSEVWANLDVPNALWVLSDTSMFLRVLDVPTAGWVSLTRTSLSWARVIKGTGAKSTHGYAVADMPMPAGVHDTIAVALRNADPTRMRAKFGGTHHPMHDYAIEHGAMRAIDFKTISGARRSELAEPSQFARNHAGVRGLDLMACTTGAAMHKIIRENLEAFTTVIPLAEFERIKAAQRRISHIAEVITEPIVQQISQLSSIGPYLSDAEGADDEDEDEDTTVTGDESTPVGFHVPARAAAL